MECVECGPPTIDDYKWVYMLLIASFFESMCLQAALHKGRRIFVHLTSIVNSEIYNKSLSRKDIADQAKEKKAGKKGDDEDAEKKKSINIASKYHSFTRSCSLTHRPLSNMTEKYRSSNRITSH